jgi:VanZ family protein
MEDINHSGVLLQTMLNRKHIKYWLPVIAWMGIIFYMSTDLFSSDNTSRIIEPILYFLFSGISPDDVVLLHWLIRKAGHVIEYFILGLLLFWAFRGASLRVWQLSWTITAVVVVVFYALSDEFHQSFVGTRTASLFDAFIDSMGGILAQLVIALWCRCCRNRKATESDR